MDERDSVDPTDEGDLGGSAVAVEVATDEDD